MAAFLRRVLRCAASLDAGVREPAARGPARPFQRGVGGVGG